MQSNLLLLFLIALTVLSQNTRASGKDIQSKEKFVMVRDDGKGVVEVPAAQHLLAYSAVSFAASVRCQAGPGR